MKYLLSKCIVYLVLLCVFNINSYAMGILYEHEPHSIFTSISTDKLDLTIYDCDFNNQALQEYTINDIIFVLETYPTSISGEELEGDNAKVYFDLSAFTMNQNETTSFKVHDIHLITAENRIAKSNLIIHDIGGGLWGSSSPFIQSLQFFPGLENCEVYRAHTKETTVLFPRPKDMEYSLEITLELNQNGETSMHTLRYNYRLEMKKHNFRYVGP